MNKICFPAEVKEYLNSQLFSEDLTLKIPQNTHAQKKPTPLRAGFQFVGLLSRL